MQKYTAVAIVSVSIVTGIIVSLWYNHSDIALGLVGLGGSLAVALGVTQHRGGRPPAQRNN